MNPINPLLDRRSPRSSVFMSAVIEFSGSTLSVKVRDVSAGGAMVQSRGLPMDGSTVLFRRGKVAVPARLAWVNGDRGGIAFEGAVPPLA